ncbi:hypothetical protein ARMGADRAFT_1077746 [Armillaria gallica]|uniref:Uncharacterized protein n=1 Tax=Armillaria gallica TaxID=47427 RepID=A0A2H3DQB4_ARMGA|nr:hypothetical protein ARMGADRAFT_1077746 [Armillaria gallica]
MLSFLNLGVHWYGSVLVLASVNGGVVDIDESNEFCMMVEQSVREFVNDYIAEWKAEKKSVNYELVKEDELDVFLTLYQ